MNRTQIQLTDGQIKKLRRAARASGVSVAEMIRRLVDQGVDALTPGTEERYAKAARHIGAFRDRGGASDVSEQHDRYLDQAFK